MKGVDTNILLRLITADDREQVERLRRYLRRERQHAPFWVNRIVLCELVWSLTTSYKFDRPTVAAVIMLLLRSDEVAIEGHPVVGDASTSTGPAARISRTA